MKGKAGKPTTNNAIYGYKKDRSDKDHWLVDEEAAAVVRRIFRLAVEGHGPHEIAKILTQEKVECPAYYLARNGRGSRKNTVDTSRPYDWYGFTVSSMLTKPEYMGHTVNFRSSKKSYRDKRVKNDPSDWLIFENTHEAIVDPETWQLAQQVKRTVRRTDTTGVANPFTGLVFCADCGAKMYSHRGRHTKLDGREYGSDTYNCSTYCLTIERETKQCFSHSVSTKALNELVLETIRTTASYAISNREEFIQKVRSSRLAREFVPALPIELTPAQWQELLTDFIQNNFVADGMCADVAVHDPYPPGHNPHAHIMVTVRPLDEKGNWQYKTEKEYLCVRNGEERGFTAAEFKAVQADGWEKQYPYKVGRKKVYLPPSEAEKHGYERVSKYPKSTKYGRQNPISERWNSEEQLVQWRKAWADAANRYLERYGHEERIDHRSHAERGLDEQPTIHEGVFARSLERQGVISDRCEINRQIKADNALLRELKAAVRKLAQAVKNTIPALAEAMERLRGNMIIFRYQLRHIGMGKHRMNEHKPRR